MCSVAGARAAEEQAAAAPPALASGMPWWRRRQRRRRRRRCLGVPTTTAVAPALAATYTHEHALTFRNFCSSLHTARRRQQPPPDPTGACKPDNICTLYTGTLSASWPSAGGVEGTRPGCFNRQPALQRDNLLGGPGAAGGGAQTPCNTGCLTWPPSVHTARCSRKHGVHRRGLGPASVPVQYQCRVPVGAGRAGRARRGGQATDGMPSMRRPPGTGCSRGREWIRRRCLHGRSGLTGSTTPRNLHCRAATHHGSARS